MNRLTLFFFIFLVVSIVSNAQSSINLSGKIVDSQTYQVIQYVSVEIEGKNRGTLTNVNGIFKLNIHKRLISDSLSIRIIGYQPKTIAIKTLLQNESDTIFLTPTTYALPEAIISSNKEYPKLIIGVNKKSNGEFLQRAGGQLAVFCENSDSINGIISKVRFYIKKGGKYKAPFRVHIYSLNLIDSLPGKELLKEDLIVSSDKKKWFEVDVEKYNISIPTGGFFVAMEWIYTDERYSYVSEPSRKKYRSEVYGQQLGGIEGTELTDKTYIKSLGSKWHKLIIPSLQKENKSCNALIGAEVLVYPD